MAKYYPKARIIRLLICRRRLCYAFISASHMKYLAQFYGIFLRLTSPQALEISLIFLRSFASSDEKIYRNISPAISYVKHRSGIRIFRLRAAGRTLSAGKPPG